MKACEAEGVIIDIRGNGAIVFVPSYGIKGPIYCCNPNGESIFVAGMLDDSIRYDPTLSMQPVVGGRANITKEQIELKAPSGKNVFLKRFDHVLLRIRVAQSRYKFNQYEFILLGTWTEKPGRDKPVSKAIIEAEVKQQKIQSQMLDSLDSNAALKEMYGQSQRKHNLYAMFNKFTEMSLMVED